MAAATPVLVLLLALLTQGAWAIDCYDCVSVAGSNLGCEDEFHQDLSTLHFISRDCRYNLFSGNYCFKLKGIRQDGTHFIVRRCSDADWGTTCGDIRYLYDDKEERIQGCLTSCSYDGCNLAPPYLRPSHVLLIAGVVITSFRSLLQNLLGLC